MVMLRYLLILLFVLLLLWFARGGGSSRPRGGGAGPRRGSPQPMVECAHCGVHLPRDDALAGPGGHYCCEEHRRLGSKA